jgi:hypothetical protein
VTRRRRATVQAPPLAGVRVRARLSFSFTADISSAGWLSNAKADVQIDVYEETWVQGSTMTRPVEVHYAADYVPSVGTLGELEQVVAIDAPVTTGAAI